jgi:hypothetical protein
LLGIPSAAMGPRNAERWIHPHEMANRGFGVPHVIEGR